MGYRASLVTEGKYGVDARGAARRKKAGGKSRRYDNGNDSGECPWIGDRDTGNLAREKAREPKAGEEAYEHACHDQPETVEEHKAQNVCLLRSQRQANAN